MEFLCPSKFSEQFWFFSFPLGGGWQLMLQLTTLTKKKSWKMCFISVAFLQLSPCSCKSWSFYYRDSFIFYHISSAMLTGLMQFPMANWTVKHIRLAVLEFEELRFGSSLALSLDLARWLELRGSSSANMFLRVRRQSGQTSLIWFFFNDPFYFQPTKTHSIQQWRTPE